MFYLKAGLSSFSSIGMFLKNIMLTQYVFKSDNAKFLQIIT